jgi:hypothetical protein
MSELVPVERIVGKIYLIRKIKVMLDRDLAELYRVETRALKQAVRRNINGFHLISCLNSVGKSSPIGDHNL